MEVVGIYACLGLETCICPTRAIEDAQKDGRPPKVQRTCRTRGGSVKDDEAVKRSSQTGASASQVVPTKFYHTVARLPGMSGQANDDVTAFTKVFMSDAPRLLNPSAEQEGPKSRNNTQDPVVPKECDVKEQRWKKVQSWECLYVAGEQLFLSIYVDDDKMVENPNIDPMWKCFGKEIVLEGSAPL